MRTKFSCPFRSQVYGQLQEDNVLFVLTMFQILHCRENTCMDVKHKQDSRALTKEHVLFGVVILMSLKCPLERGRKPLSEGLHTSRGS